MSGEVSGIIKALDYAWYCTKMVVLVALMCWIVTKTYLNSIKTLVQDNWTQYRYNPAVMPFAHHFGRDPGKNAMGYLFTSFKGSFGFLMKPLQYIMKIIHNTMAKHHQSMNLFRAILKPIRIFFMSATKKFYDMINNFTGMSVYLFAKIRDTLRRMGSTFQLSLYSLQASQLLIQSIWDGPVGTVSRDFAYALDAIRHFFCLAPTTLVRMADYTTRRVDQLQIGDYIYDGDGITCITGMVKTEASQVPLFRYRGECMSGTHSIYVDRQWYRVQDCPDALSLPHDDSITTLYCPLTTSHRLQLASGLIVSDFEEVRCPQLERYHLDISMRYLNPMSNVTNLPNILPTDQPGWSENTPVLLSDGTYQKISQLQIGDRTRHGKILGVVRFIPQEPVVQLGPEMYCTGRQLIQDTTLTKSSWHLANQFNKARRPCHRDRVYYSLITTSGIYQTAHYLAGDVFDGLPAHHVTQIEQRITEHLNASVGSAKLHQP